MNNIKKGYRSLLDIVFPVTCVCCGCSTADSKQYICDWCRHDRFAPAGYEKAEILPGNILMRYSLWRFDKGGYLQQMLHNLKYQHLMGVGGELGKFLGDMFVKQAPESIIDELNSRAPVLVPVPLHPSKRRKRGYNQARAIALGVSLATGWDITETNAIIRAKKTKTQTGLTSAQRSENLKGAFSVSDTNRFQNNIPVIVDDVFTTGATTFELVDTILKESNQKAVILTIAKA